MVNEIWKDIKGYEGYYQVSNMGRVKSCERIDNTNHKIREKILKPKTEKNGYLRVHLRTPNTSKYILIHRLVAESFLPNSNNKLCIDHINTDRKDNRVENLRWVTHKENINNPITLLKKKNANLGNKNPMYGVISWENKRSRKVVQLTKNGEIIGLWGCINDIKRSLGICVSNIPNCCKGKLKHTVGYKWQYMSDYLADWLEQRQIEFMEKEKGY